MELSGNWLTGAGAAMGGGDYFKGWVPLSNHTKWVPPFRHDDAVDAVANDADWPVKKTPILLTQNVCSNDTDGGCSVPHQWCPLGKAALPLSFNADVRLMLMALCCIQRPSVDWQVE